MPLREDFPKKTLLPGAIKRVDQNLLSFCGETGEFPIFFNFKKNPRAMAPKGEGESHVDQTLDHKKKEGKETFEAAKLKISHRKKKRGRKKVSAQTAPSPIGRGGKKTALGKGLGQSCNEAERGSRETSSVFTPVEKEGERNGLLGRAAPPGEKWQPLQKERRINACSCGSST